MSENESASVAREVGASIAHLTEYEAMRQLLDALPIYATRIGYRTDSTPEEKALGEFMWEVHARWEDFKNGSAKP